MTVDIYLGKASLKFSSFNSVEEYKIPFKDYEDTIVGKLCVDLNVINQGYEFSEFTILDFRIESNFNPRIRNQIKN